ncbi:MAG TPA: S53 family peptidase [Candidatus Aquilonibacter sp.]|nr:S53 family peptidase [Candidatus Aquilonibacter sp.]
MMMKRTAALAATIALAACAGHGTSNAVLPSPGSNGQYAHTAALTAPTGWAPTATQAIASINGAALSGPLAAATKMTIRVGLNLHNVTGLQQLIASGQTISPGTFAAQYGPTSSDVSAVTAYLQSQGFTNITAEGQLVSADGTAAQVSKAFNTTLNAYTLNGASVYANATPAFVPSNLGGIVSAVLGLNTAARMSVTPHKTMGTACIIASAPNGDCLPEFNAATVQAYYDAASLAPATNTSVAVISEGDVSGVITDLRYAESQQGLPQVPATIVTVGLASPDTSGAAEWDLDSQSSTGMAQNVKMLYMYATTSLTDSDIANAYNKWVTQHVANVGNSSFGECEYQAWLDGSMKVDDNEFMQAAAQGQTMFASSGDTGSACALVGTNGVPGSGIPMVEYPSASPYVMSVGGTTVVANANSTAYVGETAWNAGGGGLSQFENGTSWQQTLQPVSGAGAAATNLRGLPDIAMAADANAGAYVVYGQNIPGVGACPTGCGIGGTSEASPLAMGSYARILSAHSNSLGFAPPLFYKNFAENSGSATTVTGPPPTQTTGGFHDIITGANGAYTAAPGYDYTTGLGTLDVAALSSLIGH